MTKCSKLRNSSHKMPVRYEDERVFEVATIMTFGSLLEDLLGSGFDVPMVD